MHDRLEARTRRLTLHPVRPDAPFVLYWMRTAVRAHDNPALDVAITVANQLGVPVFVYHGVSERYPYANDRHHTFILQGARDVAAQLAERGVATAFHCERPGHRGPHLRTLAEQAALVVTEEMPVSPLRAWTRRLADHLAQTPLWAVDTACMVPMRQVGPGIDRAFAYRRRATPLLERFLQPTDDVEPTVAPKVPELPFEPVDWESTSIPNLVASCAIDHTVAPVPHTVGGSTAGYQRWRAFIEQGIDRYDRVRNDPLRSGTSRMSAYLHYGMVSPLRLGREARAHGGRGADKLFDELFVWRELAYTWCLYQPVHEGLEALPDWARRTLAAHADDPRRVLDRETLARGRTGDPLWDLAQTSLLRHGELHNNVRMTWGKALLGWTAGPTEALETLVDLNHRYALDGRDPASYGGLLWCLGLFDRPFPPSPVFGQVRSRSLEAHRGRLDLERWARQVGRPVVPDPPRVAVIGAGPAGAFCARVLADHGLPVVVFDKARGSGGRMSTRRHDALRFDHGAQYLTARAPQLQRYVDAWRERGLLAIWDGPFGTLGADGFVAYTPSSPRLVPVPGSSALVKHLLDGLETRFGGRVEQLERHQGWIVQGERFDRVVVAIPAPQAVDLLGDHPFGARLTQVQVAPCWTVLAEAGAGSAGVPWAAVRPESGPLAWIARNQTKPGRPQGEQWVLQATPAWSAEHLEEAAEGVGANLVQAACSLTGVALQQVSAHRWRYALVTEPVGEPCLYDPEAGLGVCGDALLGGRVEAALQSGAALAGRILGHAVACSPLDGLAIPGEEAPGLFG